MAICQATTTEEEVARPHMKLWVPIRKHPFVMCSVPDEGGPFCEVLAWRPLAEVRTPTGRFTRAWPVHGLQANTVMCLKDTWRATVTGVCKEPEILATLNMPGARSTPKFFCSNDFADHITRTNLYTSRPQGAGPVSVTPRTHNRFIEGFVGLQLKRFKSSKQLMQAVYDAFIAHQDAFTLCGILHRDVSGNNILLMQDGRGILSGWDLAWQAKGVDSGPENHTRMGTLHFTSSRLLSITGKEHVVQDDLESFIHVVLYYGLRYLNHNEVDNLKATMWVIFERCYTLSDGSSSGGSGKAVMFYSRMHIPHGFAFTGNAPMTAWLNTVIKAVRQLLVYHDNLNNALEAASSTDPLLRELLMEIGSTSTTSFDDLYLRTHDSMADWWRVTLAKPGWPTDESPHDQLPDTESDIGSQ